MDAIWISNFYLSSEYRRPSREGWLIIHKSNFNVALVHVVSRFSFSLKKLEFTGSLSMFFFVNPGYIMLHIEFASAPAKPAIPLRVCY